jgi:hypothetical protein
LPGLSGRLAHLQSSNILTKKNEKPIGRVKYALF